MAVVKYRYQQKAGINLEQIRKEVDTTVTLDESHGGAIENISVESTRVADLDEAQLRRGFVRIGTAVTAYPGEDDDFAAWKEVVLHINQLLNGASGGILQAIMADIASLPADGDTFVITDGTTTETYTFRTVPTLAFEVLIGGTPSATELNLRTTINTDSVLWSAVQTTDLDRYFSPVAVDQLVIYRKTTSLANDRVYGTIAGGNAAIQIIDFGTMLVDGKNDQEYGSDDGTQGNLPAADTALKMFGFGRQRAPLRTAESHFLASGLRPYTWDELNEVWVSVSSSDGADELKFGADALTATTTTRYLYPSYSDSLAQVLPVQYRASRNGVIRNMRVRHNSTAGNGNSIVYTFRKNGVNQTLTATLASTGTDASDLVNSFIVAAGDLIDVAVTKALNISGSPTDIVVTAEFTV